MASKDVCGIFCYDKEKVDRLKGHLENQDTLPLARIFKALADDTRMKIAYMLCQEEEVCVCDVANAIDSTVATASHHLRLLRNMGLAKYRKEGRLVFYSLDDEYVKNIILHAIDGKEAVSYVGSN